MSRELIESIISNNMLEANDMVEAKMAEIRERKMYEMKRMYAARMDETFGALTKADIEARRKAGYKKASEILGDPREKERKSPRINPGAKILKKKVSEEISEDWNRAIKMGIRRTGTRLAYGLGHAVGRPIGLGMKAADAAKKVVSDPIPAVTGAVSSAAKATAKGVGRSVKRAADAPVWKDLQDIGFRNI